MSFRRFFEETFLCKDSDALNRGSCSFIEEELCLRRCCWAKMMISKHSQGASVRLLFLLVFAFPIFAYADDPDSMVRLTCNNKQSYLLIEEFAKEMDFDVPYPRVIKSGDMTISARGLMWATESPEGVVTWHNKAIRRVCRLGKHTFVASLSGYKFNENIQGMCGAGSPTLSLTVQKDQKLVAKNLVLNNMCASPKLIKSIRFDPKANLALITWRDTQSQSESVLRVSTTTAISRERMFDEK